MAEPTPAGRLVETELDRHIGCREQRELLGGGPFCHTPIMNGGCDSLAATRGRPEGSVDGQRRQSAEADDPEVDTAVVELVEQPGKGGRDGRIAELGVGQIEMQP